MSIKITDKILSIPPHISTSWTQIAAIHMRGSALIITMLDGETVSIPNLPTEVVQQVFSTHAAYLESQTKPVTPPPEAFPFHQLFQGQGGDASIRFALGSMEDLGTISEHNPDQADAPDLPPQLLEKIAEITRVIGPQDPAMLPKGEPNCNCFYCQIANAISAGKTIELPKQEPETHDDIKPEDLEFQQWTVVQTGDKLYTVTNKLDTYEQYHVFLGDPVGCTCGRPGCEHIVAVLKS